MKKVATSGYDFVFVPDTENANLVYIKTTEGKEYILQPEGSLNAETIIRSGIKG